MRRLVVAPLCHVALGAADRGQRLAEHPLEPRDEDPALAADLGRDDVIDAVRAWSLAWLTGEEMSALRLADPRLPQLVQAALRAPTAHQHAPAHPSRAHHGQVHHVELWVPDIDRATRSWGWLLTELGYQPFQQWAGGRSWRRHDRHPYAGGLERYAAYLSDTDGYEVELVTDDA